MMQDNEGKKNFEDWLDARIRHARTQRISTNGQCTFSAGYDAGRKDALIQVRDAMKFYLKP